MKKMLKKGFALLLILVITLVLVPSTVQAEEKTVTTNEALTAAIQDGNTIVLGNDFTLSIEIPADVTVTLDLNGYSLTNTDNQHTITNKGTLVIIGEGQVINHSQGKSALVNYPNALATLKNGMFTASNWYTIKNLGTLSIEETTKVQSDTSDYSLIANGWYGNPSIDLGTSYSNTPAVLTIHNGTFSGGMNTIKNDDGGELTIRDGIFSNTAGPAILNWNLATIYNGIFEAPNDHVLANGYLPGGIDQGQLTIYGGIFTSGNQGNAPLLGKPLDGQNGGSIIINNAICNGIIPNNATYPYSLYINSGTFLSEVPTQYISSEKTVVMHKTNMDTKYYIGTSDEITSILRKVVTSGDSISILQGSINLSNTEDNVTIENKGEGSVIVNGNTVNKDQTIITKHIHNIQAVAKKPATALENGNIAYWYCLDCGKYFSDQALTHQITPEDTIIQATGIIKKPNKTIPYTADTTNYGTWFALMIITASGFIGATIYYKKKKIQ